MHKACNKEQGAALAGPQAEGRRLRRGLLLAAVSSPLLGCTNLAKLNEAPSMVDVMNRRAKRDTPQVITASRPFDEKTTRAAMEPGDATLEGVLFSRANARGYDALLFDNANPILPARKRKVTLYPLTPYAVELINLNKQQRQSKSLPKREVRGDKGFYAHSRVVETDNYGRFSFSRLKPGRYFLSAESELQGEQNVDVETGYTKHPDTSASVHYTTEARTWTRPVLCEMAVEIKPGERLKKVDARLHTHPSEWAKPLPELAG